MLNWKLKSCVRCGGDQYIERDSDGWYVQCLQCSHRTEINVIESDQLQVSPIGMKTTISGSGRLSRA